MPYKFETDKKLIPRELDKRIKLTSDDKKEILALKGNLSQRKTANLFNISRKAVVFIWYPERLEHSKKLYKERRKDGRYTETSEQRAKTMREYRARKKELNNRKKLI